jgi:hypothetical protein
MPSTTAPWKNPNILKRGYNLQKTHLCTMKLGIAAGFSQRDHDKNDLS